MKPSTYLRIRACASFIGIECDVVQPLRAIYYHALVGPGIGEGKRPAYRLKDEGRALRLCLAASIAEANGE